MIVDSPLLAGMTSGSGKAIPQEGDAQVVVPPTIIPSTQALQPHAFFGGSTGNPEGSSITSLRTQRTNLAATSLQIVILQRGLYKISLSLAARFNYTNTINEGAEIRGIVGAAGVQTTFLCLFPVIGGFSSEMEFDLLVLDFVRFDARLGLTGVGETIDQHCCVAAARIL